jgi:hypothetical protein
VIAALIPALAPILGKVVGNLFPDPAEAAKAEAQLLSELHRRESEIQTAVAGIIQAEAKSEHVLTATWRPITMLTFLAMLVGYWFDVLPDAAYQRITPDMFDQFVGLLKIGVGGYIASRGVEKYATIQAAKKD